MGFSRPFSTLLLAAGAACAPAAADASGGADDRTPVPAVTQAVGAGEVPVAPPLEEPASYYEAAAQERLGEVRPEERPDLHNLYRLSRAIISGSEPQGEDAFRKLSEMGVRTVLSVDGKTPDAELAARFGMHYVHVPIQYKGMTDEELLRISKTFREQEGPFYVHCFHGKHRGPAAAAVGRLVIDGVSREHALAEMRQWCGTSEKYEGLYAVVGGADIPGANECAGYEWDFPAAHEFEGFRGGMVALSRAYDNLLLLARNDWRPSAEHPDIEAQNEAEILVGVFDRTRELEETAGRPEDFQAWLRDSAEESRQLREWLARADANTADEAAREEADASFKALKRACDACHAAYRDR